jgi:hypothetical protein
VHTTPLSEPEFAEFKNFQNNDQPSAVRQRASSVWVSVHSENSGQILQDIIQTCRDKEGIARKQGIGTLRYLEMARKQGIGTLRYPQIARKQGIGTLRYPQIARKQGIGTFRYLEIARKQGIGTFRYPKITSNKEKSQ